MRVNVRFFFFRDSFIAMGNKTSTTSGGIERKTTSKKRGTAKPGSKPGTSYTDLEYQPGNGTPDFNVQRTTGK